ncbi:MAG TPA: 2-dehydropantoate 2-reductase N-terminal domain-containing protein [Acidimicrobiales bacterium]|nr:2-dehydropantoate 2-reductase N-terminal domain-containing protein [Acidimicrobiales bacterium]
MRYVILGAGAIGCAIGGRLFEHGHDVVLVARGAHQAALATRGLELRDPKRTVKLPIAAASSPVEAGFDGGDIAILATKTQHSEALLVELAMCAPPSTAVVCAQNGVENERLALRRFSNVQAMCVVLPASYLEPGVVEIPVAPLTGILDVGRYPAGADDVSERVAADLNESSFDSRVDADVMARKYLKLLSNIGNAIEAACGTRTKDPAAAELWRLAREEASRCFEAAGIEVADAAEDAGRRRAFGRVRPFDGRARPGGSSWQSLARRTGNIEADWLNGEIVLLGRRHGIATPVNELLQVTANRMAADRVAPGSIPANRLLALL